MTWRLALFCAAITIALTGPAYAAASARTKPTPTPTFTPIPAPYLEPQTTATPAPNGATPIPLTLRDAKMVAVKQSPQLEVARASIDLANGQLESATAGALPDFSATGNAGRQKSTFRTGSGSGGFTNALFTQISASVNLKQLIFDGGSTYARISAARFSRDAAALNELRQIDIVLFNVAQAYYAALQARSVYQTATESRRLAEVQEQLVEAQFRAGVASRADVLTAQLPVAQARLAEVQAANGEQSQIAGLLNLMGLPADTPVNLVDQPTGSPPALPAYATLTTMAVAQRSDLRAANASLTAARRSVRAARASRFPAITGNASAGTATTGVNNAGAFASNGGTYASSYSFGAGVTMPLFDSGLINGQIVSAQAQERTAQANLRTAELGVSLNVRQAYLGAQTSVQQVAAAKIELDQAQTVLDVTNAQYKAGVTTLPLLLNAQVGLSKAKSDYVNALFGAYIAEQNLYFATGIISIK